MPSSAVKTTVGTHFEALYEAPWGGVASDKYLTDIAPNQFAVADGLAIRDGKLCSEYWNYNSSLFNASFPVTGALIQAFLYVGGYLAALDQFGNAYLYSVIGNQFNLDQTIPGFSGGTTLTVDCLQVIADVAYIFSYTNGTQYVYTPGVSYIEPVTAGSEYAAGKYCMVLDGYLLTANSNQPTDTPAIKPNRVNWSAPYQFTVFDPSVSRNAGYNVLADVEDQITGMFPLGNVGYVIRTNGITQLTPTGVAIQPFDFPTLIGGAFGIGCSFPQTLSTYGFIAAFGDSSDFYFFTGSAPEPICGAAKTAIYNDINALFQSGNLGNTAVSGCFWNMAFNQVTPELCYTICITQYTGNLEALQITDINLVFWTYNVKMKTWMRNTFALGAYLHANYTIPGYLPHSTNGKLVNVKFPPPTNFVNRFSKATYPMYVYSGSWVGGGSTAYINIAINVFQNLYGIALADMTVTPGFQLYFKQEEVKIYRQPTVVFLVIRASGYGTITVQVGNTTWTPITLNSNNMVTYTSSGIQTAECPQIILTSTNFYGTINKVMMSGSYGDGELG